MAGYTVENHPKALLSLINLNKKLLMMSSGQSEKTAIIQWTWFHSNIVNTRKTKRQAGTKAVNSNQLEVIKASNFLQLRNHH